MRAWRGIRLSIMPSSKMKLAIAAILKREGFINDYTVVEGTPCDTISYDPQVYDRIGARAITGLQAREQARPAHLHQA